MISSIGCTRCNKRGMLPIKFQFMAKVHNCEHCHESHITEWTYHFCDLECFTKWFHEQDIVEKGFPCKYCNGSGECSICGGTRRILKPITNFKIPNIDANSPLEFIVMENPLNVEEG